MNSAPSVESLLPIIAKLMEELHPEAVLHRQITLDSALDRDLGLDSLARMELLTRLEKEFGVRLPEKVLVQAETPRDLLRHLKQQDSKQQDSTHSTLSSVSMEKEMSRGFRLANVERNPLSGNLLRGFTRKGDLVISCYDCV